MKLIRITFATLLALAVAAAVPAFAQHDRDDDSQHGRGHDKDRDNDRGHGHDRAVGHERHDRDDHGRHDRDDRDARDWHEGRGHHDRDWDDHERHEAREWHERREHEREWNHERYVWYAQHHPRYIPEDHFRAHFGYGHRFVIVRPVIVEGRPRFRYGGYWFVIGRPLPPGWRYSDEVYVDYIDDGYYMCSPAHPGIHISVDIL